MNREEQEEEEEEEEKRTNFVVHVSSLAIPFCFDERRKNFDVRYLVTN